MKPEKLQGVAVPVADLLEEVAVALVEDGAAPGVEDGVANKVPKLKILKNVLSEWAVVDRAPVNVDVALEAVHPVRKSRRRKVDARDLDHGIVEIEVDQEIENTEMSMTDEVVIVVDHG